jgi:hypothetical protein
MLLPMAADLASKVSLHNHLALVALRQGQGHADLIAELLKTVYVAYDLLAPDQRVAHTEHFARAEPRRSYLSSGDARRRLHVHPAQGKDELRWRRLRLMALSRDRRVNHPLAHSLPRRFHLALDCFRFERVGNALGVKHKFRRRRSEYLLKSLPRETTDEPHFLGV